MASRTELSAQTAETCATFIAEATRRRRTAATAESITAGALAAAWANIPGASAVLQGGIISYSSATKAALLGVDEKLLNTVGAVDAQVAIQMAYGAAQRSGTTIGISTTGVAGPARHEGQDVGTVFIGFVLRSLAPVEDEVFGDRTFGDNAPLRVQAEQAKQAPAWLEAIHGLSSSARALTLEHIPGVDSASGWVMAAQRYHFVGDRHRIQQQSVLAASRIARELAQAPVAT